MYLFLKYLALYLHSISSKMSVWYGFSSAEICGRFHSDVVLELENQETKIRHFYETYFFKRIVGKSEGKL